MSSQRRPRQTYTRQVLSPEERATLLVALARGYFEEGLDQASLAKRYSISRATVSKLLREAREAGIVEIHIREPAAMEDDLETALVAEFGLAAAHVVPAIEANLVLTMDRLAHEAARRIETLLRPNGVLGLSWGRTLAATVDALTPSAARSGITVLPLVGGAGQAEPHLQVNSLVRVAAERVGGQPLFLHAPGVVGSVEAKDVLLADETIRAVVDRWPQIDLAVVGIGGLSWKPSLLRTGYLSESELKHLDEIGAVGDVCYRLFDACGQEVHSSTGSTGRDRIIAVDFATLRSLPNVIGVAGGPDKVAAIRGALRGRLVKTLITDSVTARRLLEVS